MKNQIQLFIEPDSINSSLLDSPHYVVAQYTPLNRIIVKRGTYEECRDYLVDNQNKQNTI